MKIYIVKTLTEAEAGDLHERFVYIGTNRHAAVEVLNTYVQAEHWLNHKVILATWDEENQKMDQIIASLDLK